MIDPGILREEYKELDSGSPAELLDLLKQTARESLSAGRWIDAQVNDPEDAGGTGCRGNDPMLESELPDQPCSFHGQHTSRGKLLEIVAVPGELPIRKGRRQQLADFCGLAPLNPEFVDKADLHALRIGLEAVVAREPLGKPRWRSAGAGANL